MKKFSCDNLKTFYDNTFQDVFKYLIVNCKDINECQSLILATYKTFILYKRTDEEYLLDIAKDLLIKENDNFSTQIYIEEPFREKTQYTIEDYEVIKKHVFDCLESFIGEYKLKTNYRRQKVFAFLFLLFCVIIAVYAPMIQYTHNEYSYLIHDIERIDNRIIFSDDQLRYVDITKTRKVAHSYALPYKIDKFHIFEDSIIYSNNEGIYVCRLSGEDNTQIMSLPGGMLINDFMMYEDNIYCNVTYLDDNITYNSIYCYNIQDKTFQSVYSKTISQEESYPIKLIGIINDMIYILGGTGKEENTIKVFNINTKNTSTFVEISNATISKVSIDANNKYIYVLAAYKKRKDLEVFFKYKIIKYSLTGVQIDISEEFDNKANMMLSDNGELFYESNDRVYKTNVFSGDTEVVSNVSWSLDVFFINDLICYSNDHYGNYYLCVIDHNKKVTKYYIKSYK